METHLEMEFSGIYLWVNKHRIADLNWDCPTGLILHSQERVWWPEMKNMCVFGLHLLESHTKSTATSWTSCPWNSEKLTSQKLKHFSEQSNNPCFSFLGSLRSHSARTSWRGPSNIHQRIPCLRSLDLLKSQILWPAPTSMETRKRRRRSCCCFIVASLVCWGPSPSLWVSIWGPLGMPGWWSVGKHCPRCHLLLA